MAPQRRHIGASRRQRRDDDGEDEGSLAGDLEDDSLSEGSVRSHQEDEDADVEGSETEDETAAGLGTDKLNGRKTNGREPRRSSTSPTKPGLKTTVSDTEAMLNGLKVSDDSEEIQFHQVNQGRELQTGRTPSAPPTEPKRETLATRKRREHEKYVKERDQNPAFVPTRGSFFLHDKRTSELGSNNHRSSNKGKSRPYGLIVDGNTQRDSSKPDASVGQWAHDLHDTVAGDEPPAPKHSAPSAARQPPPTVPTAPKSSPPNRTFSSTVLLGNVPVVVFLPGMAQPKPTTMAKKQHTRLPQHRPPLRRDKPVRISLPDQAPRYIFPSTERSFIFIPRAMRPNQHTYRGRGRGGGFYPRRPSLYSNYAPSIPPSRRTSLGMSSQDSFASPTGSCYSRPIMMPPDASKPIVRLPPPPRPIVPIAYPSASGMPIGGPGSMPPMPLPHPAYRESRPAPIPMHQPRPKKTVSVADIESPDNFPFNPPQPQHEQPFHHQVPIPVPINGPGQDLVARGPPSQSSATPLSQIPERAIHAPAFQPFNVYPQPGFYPNYYPGGMYYPNSGPEYPIYNGPMGPGASVPNFAPGPQPIHHQAPGPSREQQSQPGMVAHESGGTVYFYDPNQMYTTPNYGAPGPGLGSGGVVGMGGMMTPPGTGYYFPQPPGAGGVYYGQ
ncbi:hypothetical protein N7466_006207 [Penicillium verhagenii]|uniref:uncharacterized protein n=1 Tax=Penicillium verhagenii TaxID=1562060 RepID=UPI002544E731|nr:uncharacterized protein N7466_006207 [Penicillium verhagenii]KAJ5930714.1 hypothetical protein N7466_006207 [Penicillium verhagenii]